MRDGKSGTGIAFAQASCRIAPFRRYPVSEVGQWDGFVLVFIVVFSIAVLGCTVMVLRYYVEAADPRSDRFAW